MRLLPIVLLLPLAALAACTHDLGGPGDGDTNAPPSGDVVNGDGPNDVPPSNDVPPANDAPPTTTQDPTHDEAPPGEPPPSSIDPDGDGIVNDGAPGTPANANASCVGDASTCGNGSDTELPGFECVSSTCTCDPSGTRPSECGAQGGTWSAFECACFVNTSSPMPQSQPPTPEAARDDVVCWYVWRDTGCDPDRWVDTSYYDYYCDNPNDEDSCYSHYVEDGYYEDGTCYGRWITRCSDGNEYW